MIFDAETLARGWLSVAVAASADKDRPQLNKTMSIEQYPGGVRLVATDSYVLLRAWVPSVDGDGDLVPEPSLDESPMATAVAMDPHGRGVGFLAHLLKLATAKGSLPIEVRLMLGVIEPDESDGMLGGMEARYVVLEQPDVERLKLATYEGGYPHWRKVAGNFGAKTTKAVALSPYVLAKIAKLAKLAGTVQWHFGGANKMAVIEVAESDPYVCGAAMPVRWDFDRDAPRTDVKTDDDDQDGDE